MGKEEEKGGLDEGPWGVREEGCLKMGEMKANVNVKKKDSVKSGTERRGQKPRGGEIPTQLQGLALVGRETCFYPEEPEANPGFRHGQGWSHVTLAARTIF